MKWVYLFLFMVIFGCGPSPDTQMRVREYQQSEQSRPIPVDTANRRFEIERVGVFRDDLAYNDKRGIYVIRDQHTGREYLGISGVGISELGSHLVPMGKAMMKRADER